MFLEVPRGGTPDVLVFLPTKTISQPGTTLSSDVYNRRDKGHVSKVPGTAFARNILLIYEIERGVAHPYT